MGDRRKTKLKVIGVVPLVFMLTGVLFAGQFAVPLVKAVVARVPGVQAGDWAKFDVAYNYTTNDPTPPVPKPPPDLEDIEYYKIKVLSVTGTNISYQVIIRLRNGTEQPWVMWTDVSGHQMGTAIFIAANLSAGDALSLSPYSLVIDATLMRSYAGAEREVNYISVTANYSYSSNYWIAGVTHYYWDRASGILDEMIMQVRYTERDKGYMTLMDASLVMTETNIWGKAEAVKIDVWFMPHVLNLKSKGQWVFALVRFPRGYKSRDVDIPSITLNGTVAPKSVRVLGHRWLLLRLERTEVVSLVESHIVRHYRFITVVSLTVSGRLLDGTTFEGTGRIWVLCWKTFPMLGQASRINSL